MIEIMRVSLGGMTKKGEEFLCRSRESFHSALLSETEYDGESIDCILETFDQAMDSPHKKAGHPAAFMIQIETLSVY